MQRVESHNRTCIHSRNLVTLVDDIDNQVEDTFLKSHINTCDLCKEKLLDEMSFRERISKNIPFQAIPSEIRENLDSEIEEITSGLDNYVNSIKLGRKKESVRNFLQHGADLRTSIFDKKVMGVAVISLLIAVIFKVLA